MTAPLSSQPVSSRDAPASPSLKDIDVSCRLPLLVLFVGGAAWLVLGSAFALIASIKFHSPNFLADSAWLTYGRVRPAYLNSMLYGFCLPAGLAVGLWMVARLGRTCVVQRWLITSGAIFWNLGVALGVLGILIGDSTGFEYLEMPRYAAPFLILGYLFMGVWTVMTFHQRRQRTLFVSHWFFLAALFWFPWIYSTAELLLVKFPVRGVAQAVVAWWYAGNLHVVWLGLAGLAAVFYFIPKITERELQSRYLALFTFWVLILFGSWTGIPNSAPVPAWMPALSTVGFVLSALPILIAALSVYQTLGGNCSLLLAGPSLRFIGFGVIALLLAGLMNASDALMQISPVTNLTWFTPARLFLAFYGFFSMVMFGAIYYILPKLIGFEFAQPKLVGVHFWLAALGVIFVALPLALGGILQGMRQQNPGIAFVEIARATLPFLRASTVGDLLIALGHLLFLINLAGLVLQFYRARAALAYAAVTADLFADKGAQI